MVVDLDDELSCWTFASDEGADAEPRNNKDSRKTPNGTQHGNNYKQETHNDSVDRGLSLAEADIQRPEEMEIVFTTDSIRESETKLDREHEPTLRLLDGTTENHMEFSSALQEEQSEIKNEELGSYLPTLSEFVSQEATELVDDGISSMSSEQEQNDQKVASSKNIDATRVADTNEDNREGSQVQKETSETDAESDDSETQSPVKNQKNENKKRIIVRFSFSNDEVERNSNLSSDESETKPVEKRASKNRRSTPSSTGQLRANLSSRDLARTIRTTLTLQLTNLVKGLFSPDAMVVKNSLTQMHALIDQQSLNQSVHRKDELDDNALELGFVRRGGHLALLRSLQGHTAVPAIQVMGWAALAWLCERCNIKQILMDHGALPLVMSILQYYSVTNPQWSVVTEALYFVGHLSTLPKVARQVRFRESATWEELAPRLRLAYKDEGRDEAVESAVDAFLFCSHSWAAHQSVDILQGVFQAGSLRFVVQVLQEALTCWQSAYDAGLLDACAEYEDRLVTGCQIVTHWARTPVPTVARALIEAGALTVAAEVLRLFPAGTRLRKAANPCLRAMVPATED